MWVLLWRPHGSVGGNQERAHGVTTGAQKAEEWAIREERSRNKQEWAKWLHNPYRLGGPKVGNSYITPAALGVPLGDENQKWAAKGGTKLFNMFLPL